MFSLPTSDNEYLNEKGIQFELVEDGGQRAIILKNCSLPPGRYDQENADVLVILPNGYNDVGPDMFHTLPWVKLMPENAYPSRADVAVQFNGQNWQRWSRHAEGKDWRPGVDGIQTVIQRFKAAAEGAKR